MILKRQEVYDGSVRHTRDITVTGEGQGTVRFLGGRWTVQQHKLYGYWQIGYPAEAGRGPKNKCQKMSDSA